MDNIKIGKFIAELRKEKNMTQKELAEVLGVTDKAVSKWERGVGYPDISMLQSLADTLGVNVNKLLAGKRDTVDTKSSTFKTNNIVLDIVQYSDTVKSNDKIKRYGYFMGIASFIAICICFICNIAINQKISWALYPLGGMIIAWAGIIPFFIVRKYKFLYSVLGFYITTVPYLFLMQHLSSTKGWVIPLALPISTISAIYLFIIILLFMKLNINKWYISSIAISLLIVYNYIIDKIIELYTKVYQNMMLEVSIGFFIAIILLVIGVIKKSVIMKNDKQKI